MGGTGILAKLAESRRALSQVTEGLSERELTQIQVEGVWTIKDVLGHVTSWEGTILDPLRCFATGGPFEVDVIKDYLSWNDVQATEKRDMPLHTILGELRAVRRELVEAAAKLSAGQWEQPVSFPWGGRGTVAQALEGLYQHELEHVHAIGRWRGETSGD